MDEDSLLQLVKRSRDVMALTQLTEEGAIKFFCGHHEQLDPDVKYEFVGKFGMPIMLRILKDLIYMDLLRQAHATTFLHRYEGLMSPQERRTFMEKYGVKTDPKKVADAKKKDGEKTAAPNDPNTNVPIDPDKGTEPFETEPEDG
jgi:hypothetical protein